MEDEILYCSSKFYAVSSIKSHIQKAHPLTFITLDISKFNEFFCAYCKEESNSKKNMQIHMATVHPDEIGYIVERKLRSEADEDAIENLNLIDINVSVLPTDIHSVVFEENLTCVSPNSELEATSASKDLIQTISKEEQLLIDRIKSLLDFITSNRETQSLDEFICFHCIVWFYSREKMSDHFVTLHRDCPSFTEKVIPSANKSYYIAKKKEVLILDWTAALNDFLDRIRNNWIEKMQQITKYEWWNGLSSSCLEEIDIPELIMVGQPLYKCLVKSCPFVGIDENSLDQHVNEHTVPRNYKCSHCTISVAVPSWEHIKNHKMLHRNELHICSVCKFFHHNGLGISEHINSLHNSRDVPVISLWRDETHYKISVSIVLPPGRTSFATSLACFCCGKDIKGHTKFIRHLRVEHNILLCRKCELCNEIVLTKSEVDTHSQKHGVQVLKLKYDILVTSMYNLNIQTMSPFTVEVRSGKEKRNNEDVEATITKRPKVDEEFPIKVKEEVIVKMEYEDDANMDEFVETQCRLLKCVNMDKLVDKEHLNTNHIASNAKRSDRGKIYVKSTADLQTPRPVSITPNISQYQQKQGELNAEALNSPLCLSNQNQMNQIPNLLPYPTSLIRQSSVTQYPRYVPQPKHTKPIQVIVEIPLPNNQGTALISSPSQSNHHPTEVVPEVLKTQTCPGYPKPQYTQHKAQTVTSNVLAQSTLQTQTSPGITQPVRTHYAEQNVQPVVLPTVGHPNVNYTEINYRTHNVQSATTLTTMAPTIPIRQPEIGPDINSPGATFSQISAQSSLNLDGTQGAVSSFLNRLVPEIMPICENCKMECIDFSHLKSHFEAVHAPENARFLFRLTRRVKCVNCQFCGSFNSLPAHYKTFHPNQLLLSQSVIDHKRCGVCNGLFRVQPPSNSSLISICDCPKYKRVLADCLDLKSLNALQNFGKEYHVYVCVLCKTLHHYENEYLQHILSVHHRSDIIPQRLLIKQVLYACDLCGKTEASIKDVIEHIRSIHCPIAVQGTLSDQMAQYNKIGVIYPKGLKVYISDLRNTGTFDEECFKRDVQCVEAQYRTIQLN